MKTKTLLYNGEVELLFDSYRHAYTDSRGKIPSVTTVLGIISKPALTGWAARMAVEYIQDIVKPGMQFDEMQLATMFENAKKAHYQKKVDAGQLGSFVHKWVENYIKGEEQPIPVHEGIKQSIKKFLKWVEKHDVKFVLSEQQIYSRKHRYAGTLDFICKIDGKLYIGDLKTSSGIWDEYKIQTAAYRYAREEEFPNEKYEGQLIVRIGKEEGGDLEFAVMRDPVAYKKMVIGFIAAKKLLETMEEIKKTEVEKE